MNVGGGGGEAAPDAKPRTPSPEPTDKAWFQRRITIFENATSSESEEVTAMPPRHIILEGKIMADKDLMKLLSGAIMKAGATP